MLVDKVAHVRSLSDILSLADAFGDGGDKVEQLNFLNYITTLSSVCMPLHGPDCIEEATEALEDIKDIIQKRNGSRNSCDIEDLFTRSIVIEVFCHYARHAEPDGCEKFISELVQCDQFSSIVLLVTVVKSLTCLANVSDFAVSSLFQLCIESSCNNTICLAGLESALINGKRTKSSVADKVVDRFLELVVEKISNKDHRRSTNAKIFSIMRTNYFRQLLCQIRLDIAARLLSSVYDIL